MMRDKREAHFGDAAIYSFADHLHVFFSGIDDLGIPSHSRSRGRRFDDFDHSAC